MAVLYQKHHYMYSETCYNEVEVCKLCHMEQDLTISIKLL